MGKAPLDPLLSPALQLEQLPVLSGREAAVRLAATLTDCAETITAMAAQETEREGGAQLLNTAEAICACIINLVAYSRGRVPKVRAGNGPDANLILPPSRD